ncbi:isochorismate synthase [Xanthobacter dioxanivorans]|uniref:isochorismate synthase n=1 Tax=Xanthobacter dioxanivorans TaxID=2528964 RepID=A0A974PLW0_9HYPH|nr:isochorismate synthase [Xanthobacter dioxanivorans]QRG05733.1 isochorismate synthase [Xanthobacter dioxanivorans]
MNALTRPEPAAPPLAAPPPHVFPQKATDPSPGEGLSLFAFQSRGALLHGLGAAAALPRGPVATLDARLAAFFRSAGTEATLAGALPFDRSGDDCLWQARRVARSAPPVQGAARAEHTIPWHLDHAPDAAGYAEAVGRALHLMADEAGTAGALEKIVLSRSLVATAERDIDVASVFRRLAADPAATAFLVPLPDRDGLPRVMAGATPELLLGKSGGRVSSHPLAGSARRRADLAEDAAAAAGLAASAKDRREHAIVVEFILDTLAPFCRRLFRPQGMALASTASMWHLGTRIEGDLKEPEVPAAVLAAMLHPTPAVCGVPREKAARHIGALEGYARDFYAGAVGWCDGRGDGAWYVTIRCAEICGRRARLYAGAGIVPGSDPHAEAEETAAKYTALLTALGIPPVREVRS